MSAEARDTQGDREALAKMLIREGAAPGGSVHSWRCDYPDIYGPCDCVEQLADEILASDWLAAHVARARAEALREAADEARFPNLGWEAGGHTSAYSVRRWLRERADHIDPGADQ